MKILTIVGARPQFIKAAALSRVLRQYHTEILVHTGQHYDKNMSDIFFEELSIPTPVYNLGISNATHAQMTGRMLEKIEKVIFSENPDMLLVYGDTNSTLAGALAAVKVHVPVIHVEAGGRLGTLDNPEEVNRILTDHISTILFACTKSAAAFLKKEGLQEKTYLSGDPMYDAFLYYSKKIGEQLPVIIDINEKIWELQNNNYYYLTCHRQENTSDEATLFEILSAMQALDRPVVYPVHPRSMAVVKKLYTAHNFRNIIVCEPTGYLMSLSLVKNAKKVITDSGGLQREAFFAGKQCVTIFNHVVWPETMLDNRNQLSIPNKNMILEKLDSSQHLDETYKPFGDGKACEKICDVINRWEK